MSIVHLAAFLVGCVVLLIWSLNKLSTLPKRIGRLGLFLAILLLVSSLVNGLWSCLLWDRVYHSSDYLFDFIPFWPITWAMINRPFGNEHGQLLGISMWQLQLLWLCFACSTWAITVVLYRLTCRHMLPPSQGATANCRPAGQSGGSDNSSASNSTYRTLPETVTDFGHQLHMPRSQNITIWPELKSRFRKAFHSYWFWGLISVCAALGLICGLLFPIAHNSPM
jgi:hypothetical protein